MDWFQLRCTADDSSSSAPPWLYSFRKFSDGYVLHLTNVSDGVFEERLESDDVDSRCADLNPAIEADTEDLVEEVSNLLSSDESHVELKTDGGDQLRLEAQGKIFGYDFRWTFRATRLPADKAHDLFFSNVLKCVSHLLDQRQHLLQVVKAKDLEIYDYEQSGATLTRRSFRTEKADSAAKVLSRVPFSPKDDPELVAVLASEEYKQVQRAVETGWRRKREGDEAAGGAATTPEQIRAREKARRKRIRIKGAAAQLFDSDEDEDGGDASSPKKRSAASAPLSNSAKKSKNVAKKLKKL